MMTKELFNEKMVAIKAKMNADIKAFEVSQKKFDTIVESEIFQDCVFVQSKKVQGYYKVTDNTKKKVFGYLQIVSKTSTTKTEQKTETENEKSDQNKTVGMEKSKNDAVTMEKVAKKQSGKTIVSGGQGHKVRGDGYIIKYKNKDDKKETVLNNMTTCTEVKAFLKTVSKRQLEYLHIYDSAMNECRKSAWVG